MKTIMKPSMDIPDMLPVEFALEYEDAVKNNRWLLVEANKGDLKLLITPDELNKYMKYGIPEGTWKSVNPTRILEEESKRLESGRMRLNKWRDKVRRWRERQRVDKE